MTSDLQHAGGLIVGTWYTDPHGGDHWQLDVRLTYRRTG